MKPQARLATGAIALACSCIFGTARAEPLQEIAGILLVCESSPSAALGRAERARGNAEVSAAGVLQNPALVATHQRALSGTTDVETVIGLSVPVSVSGRRSLLQDAARARRDQADANARATLLEAALEFRETYVTAVLDQARVDVAERQHAILLGLTAALRALETRGEAAGYDILRQETQAKLHRRTLDAARARAASSRAQLVAWTGSDVALPRGSLDTLAGGPRLSVGVAQTPPPRARGLALEARAAKLEARASRRRAVPELDVFAGYRATEVETEVGHGISLGLTVPLTFFDHGQGDAARAEADAALAQAHLNVLRREQQAGLRSAQAELALLEPVARDAETVVREASELRRRAEQLYAAGETSITEVLDAFRSIEEAELGRIDLHERIARARLAVMRARGSLMDAELDRRCQVHPGGTP